MSILDYKFAWRSKDDVKRARALDKLSEKQLLLIAQAPYWNHWLKKVQLEAVDRLKDEQLLLLIHHPLEDERAMNVKLRAAEHLSAESKGVVALEQQLDSQIRKKAVEGVTDKEILKQYLLDETAIDKDDVIKNLKDGELIVELALETGNYRPAYSTLESLHDDFNLRKLLLETKNNKAIDREHDLFMFHHDREYLLQLYQAACSERVRDAALLALLKDGVSTPEMYQDACRRAADLLHSDNCYEQEFGLSMLKVAGVTLENLSDDVRQCIYQYALRETLYHRSVSYLASVGDPTGKELYRIISRNFPYDPDENPENLLLTDQGFVVDYLKKYLVQEYHIRESRPLISVRYGDHEGAEFFKALQAIRYLHANGSVRQKIEVEFPEKKEIYYIDTVSNGEGDHDDEMWLSEISFWDPIE